MLDLVREKIRDRAYYQAVRYVPLKKVCQVCDHPDTARHHPDYARPREVVHVCDNCHANIGQAHLIVGPLLENGELAWIMPWTLSDVRREELYGWRGMPGKRGLLCRQIELHSFLTYRVRYCMFHLGMSIDDVEKKLKEELGV